MLEPSSFRQVLLDERPQTDSLLLQRGDVGLQLSPVDLEGTLQRHLAPEWEEGTLQIFV